MQSTNLPLTYHSSQMPPHIQYKEGLGDIRHGSAVDIWKETF